MNHKNNVKAIMDKKGISRKSLAVDTKSSVSYIRYVECGVVDPSMTKAYKIADALGVSDIRKVFPRPESED